MRSLLGPVLILICTVIWGAAFLAQKLGSDHLGPFAVTCARNLLGGACLFALTLKDPRLRRAELVGGALSGAALFLAMSAQQIGIADTTPGVSAFLTTNYVLLVPVFAWILRRGRPGAEVWLVVALALCGTYFLCFPAGTGLGLPSLGAGEAWTILCAALFAVQIMLVDRFARNVGVIRFSMVQLFSAALCALPFSFLPGELAKIRAGGLCAGLPALLFLGVMSSGVAYTLQNLGQARTPPALAALIMSMESVFGALFGWLLLGDAMTSRQLAGCALVFLAVIVPQLISLRRRRG